MIECDRGDAHGVLALAELGQELEDAPLTEALHACQKLADVSLASFRPLCDH